MMKSRYIKIGSAALVVVAVFIVLTLHSTATAQEFQWGKSLVWRARGFVLTRDENITSRQSVLIGMRFEAQLVNRTIRLHVVNGTIKIGDVKYTVTEGVGGIGRIHRVDGYVVGLMVVRGTAVNEYGEQLTFKMFGRVIYAQDKHAAYTSMVGFIRGESEKYFLILEGLIGR